jgi:hypothetical protein
MNSITPPPSSSPTYPLLPERHGLASFNLPYLTSLSLSTKASAYTEHLELKTSFSCRSRWAEIVLLLSVSCHWQFPVTPFNSCLVHKRKKTQRHNRLPCLNLASPTSHRFNRWTRNPSAARLPREIGTENESEIVEDEIAVWSVG